MALVLAPKTRKTEGVRQTIAVLGLLGLSLALVGCNQAPTAPASDANFAAIHARFGRAKLTWLIKRSVDGEAVTCGYESQQVGVAPFIARGGRVWQQGDLAPGDFSTWEDRFCGPDWVKPLPGVPAPS